MGINKIPQSYAQASKQQPKKTEQQSTPSALTNNQQPAQQQNNTGWAEVHHQLYQAEDMKNWILLDNKSTVTIFCNPNLVNNIQN
jgi:hypothetical protein